MLIKLIIDEKSINEILNELFTKQINTLDKEESEDIDENIKCIFESPTNTFTYDGNIINYDLEISCKNCNQYVHKKNDEKLCNSLKYRKTNVDDGGLCVINKENEGFCPF